MRRKRIASLAVVGVVVGGLSFLEVAGCNLIVGAGNYNVVPEDATTPEDSGAPVLDTGGSTVVDSGTTDTGTVTPTDSGSLGDSNLPDAEDAAVSCGSTIPTTSVDFQQIMLSCVLDQGCNWGPNTTSVGLCVTYNELAAISGQTKCESGATTCAYIETCTGQGWTSCSATGPGGWSCNNNLSTYCFGASSDIPGWADYEDCTKAGGTCVTYTDKLNPDAGLQGGCEVLSSCTEPDNGDYYCSASGNFEYTCVDKVGGGTAGLGATCNEYSATCSEDGGTSCYYLLPPCDPSTTAACDGNVGQKCYTNGLNRFDCSQAGLVCQPLSTNDTVTGFPFQCVAPGCASQATPCQESCSGTVATFCIGGAPVQYDCASQNMVCDDSGTADENGNDYMVCELY
ncbi:MAG: hypothetical protein ACLQVI_05390 [Polyangiaceae bacterium]|jgi:hypothetical protein